MKLIIINLFLFISIQGYGQILNLSFKADSIDNLIEHLPALKKIKGKMITSRPDTILDIDKYTTFIIGYWHKNKLVAIVYEKEKVFSGRTVLTYYLSENKLVMVNEDYYKILHLGGPTVYGGRFTAKYYFENDNCFYKKTEGTDEEIKSRMGNDSLWLMEYNKIIETYNLNYKSR